VKAVLDTLAPVFLMIVLGMLLRWTRRLSDETFRGMNWLVFWVALPAMLFADVAGIDRPATHAAAKPPAALAATRDGGAVQGRTAAQEDYRHQFQIFLMGVAGLAACILVAYGLVALLKMERHKVGTFVACAFRGNLAFIGLPVVQYAFASLTGSAEQGLIARRDAALALAPLIILYNMLGVIVLLAGQHRMGWRAVGKMAGQIVTNPLILACAAGLVWSAAGLRVPQGAANTLHVLGDVSLPLALLSVGATIATTPLRGQVLYTCLSVAVKNALAPAIGFGAAVLLGIDRREILIGLLLLACPTAVASYVMAEQMKGDGPLAAQIVVVGTLLSIVGFAAVILLMG
jgi:malate permease and related proteins